MDNLRIKFLPGQQKKFIEDVYIKSGLSIEALAKLANIHPRSFRDWRREKLTMSLAAADLFCTKFNITLTEDKKTMIARWKKAKEEAARIGGISLFKKHGSPATPEGCRKGGMRAIANLRRNGIIPSLKAYKLPTTFTEELAEFVGIMLGDGGITAGSCAITLNADKDYEYMKFVSMLGQKLFGEAPKMYKRKDSNALVLYYNGSALIRYFLSIGLKIGNKVRQQVDVPHWIKYSQTYKISCLRGLIDTDGGIFLHRYKVNGKIYFYRKMCFTNRSVPLLKFAYTTLKELDFTPKTIEKVENKKVWLYNTNEVVKYLKKIGSHNQRLLKFVGG